MKSAAASKSSPEGRALKELRKHLGLSLAKMGGVIGSSAITNWKRETGRCGMGPWLSDLASWSLRNRKDWRDVDWDRLSKRIRRAVAEYAEDPKRLHPRYVLVLGLVGNHEEGIGP